jgi:phosphate starvation-inducible PhoH-like protein
MTDANAESHAPAAGDPEEIQEALELEDSAAFRRLCGPGHAALKKLAETLKIGVGARGNTIHLSGAPEKVALGKNLLAQLASLAQKGRSIYADDVVQALEVLSADPAAEISSLLMEPVLLAPAGRQIHPRSAGQRELVQAIRSHDIVFAVGPAGTGKTYLAMAMAIAAFKANEVGRIVLTRPAVEAGERLGFLPGDLEAKVNPYLRPLHDALFELFGSDQAEELLGRRQVEVAPLAFMRGRTLNDAFVILDEAQNTTAEQMKMFLTRLGFRSKMVITGDVTQVDLPAHRRSGLLDAVDRLGHVSGIGVSRLSRKDVVRHPLVQKVVEAYDDSSGGRG